MPKTKIPSTIKPAGYGRSLLGYSMDFLFTFLLMVVLYVSLGRTVLLQAGGYDQGRADYASLVSRSRLGEEDANHNVVDISYQAIAPEGADYSYGYEEYEKRIFHYYFVEVGRTSGETPFAFLEEDSFTSEASLGSEAYNIDVGKWVYEKIFYIKGDNTGAGDRYFALPTEDAGYLAMPSLNADTRISLEAEETKKSTADTLLYYFRNPSNDNHLYARAVTHFNSQDAVLNAQGRMNRASYIALLPSLIVSPLIFYFLIPIFSKSGRTLGKRIASTAVIGDDGFTASKARIILHYGIILLEWELLLIPSVAIGVMAWMFVSIIGFMVLSMSKNHQSIHDKIARTIVIRYRDSIWFEDEESMRAYAEANPSSLVAKTLAEQQSPTGATPVGGRTLVVGEAQLLAEESILDLSTINRRRDEARNMTSFDAFERGEQAPAETPAEPAPNEEEEEEIELTEQEKADLLALEGELPEEETPQEEDHPLNDDGFVDEQ